MLDPERSISQLRLFKRSSAVFSKCEYYRYRLDRVWDDSLPPLTFGMLNPSTADHEHNDPTIERCERRAMALGFGSLVVWNLFAFRATNPKVLREQTDPIGPENNRFIQEILGESKERRGKVVVGWGAFGQHLQRHLEVLDLARGLGVSLYCLGVTAGGQPQHPLYVSYSRKLAAWS
jgi:hypothetical protein